MSDLREIQERLDVLEELVNGRVDDAFRGGLSQGMSSRYGHRLSNSTRCTTA